MITKFKDTFSYKLIYVIRINDAAHEGMVKIGDATVEDVLDRKLLVDDSNILNNAAKKRIDEYTKTAGIYYQLLYTTLAVTHDGKGFRDHDVHSVLKRSGKKRYCFDNVKGANEWFEIDLETAKNAIEAVKKGEVSLAAGKISTGINPIVFRPEQLVAIEQTKKQFSINGEVKPGNARMLWNAKMRFGKTLTGLQVAKELNFQKTIIATHRPVVSSGWFEDFTKIFYDAPNFRFGSKTQGETLENLLSFANDGGNFVYFASIQDLRGSSLVGGNFSKNNELFACEWDYLIVDEAHEGTQTKLGDDVIRNLIKENTKTLYLSGTPFNLIKDYREGEVFTWDYVMEQRAKMEWCEKHLGDSNPYEALPRLNIYTYDIGKDIPNFEDIEDSAFNFREFFRTWTGDMESDKKPMPTGVCVGDFIYKEDVKSFLNLMVKKGEHNYPFSREEYRDNFRHTLWMVPGVKAAKALSALLKEHQVFGSGAFEIVNVAGEGDEEDGSEEALQKLRNAITDKPEETRTITLSCGRLTTGVTVDAWTACFMLSGSASTSASSYLQTIFRVQSPANIGGKMKTNCYVFDFAPDRTLKMVAEAGNLSVKAGATTSKKQMSEFLNFCPVIGISGSSMMTYSTEQMLAQLKRAMIDRVARNGFDDVKLYNAKLLKLTSVEIKKFQDLKSILGTSKATPNADDIVVNDQGLDVEVYDTKEGAAPPKKVLTKEERQRKKELEKMRKQRAAAISILRGISIRIPLLVYGAEIEDEEKGISIENFTSIIDDNSWAEFMPKGVTKKVFNSFVEYFDSDVFVESGKRIRKQARAADQLPITERIKALADIFVTFKNPDKETVLTPWKVVNMHLGDCIGGCNFFDEKYQKHINIESGQEPRVINHAGITDSVFNVDAKILDINSKTGLYPLYVTYSIYELLKKECGKTRTPDELWAEALKNNVFVICKTKMAAAITRRTLRGFNNFATNILVYEDIIMDMKIDAKRRGSKSYAMGKAASKISNPKKWGLIGGQKMRFNAIVGNPPYQEVSGQTETQTQANSKWIYHHFQNTADLLGDINSLIYPFGGWFDDPSTLQGFGEKMLSDKHTILIKAYEGTKDPRAWYRTDRIPDPFFNVNLSAGVAYLLRDMTKFYEQFTYYNRVYSDKTRTVISNEWESLAPSPEFNVGEKLFGAKLYKRNKKFFGIESDFIEKNPTLVSENKSDWSNPIVLLANDKSGSSGRTKKYWADRSIITENVEMIDKYKIITTTAYPKQKFTSGKPTIENVKKRLKELIQVLPIGSAFGKSRMCLFFSDNRKECDNYLKYTQTNFFSYILLNEPNKRSNFGYIIPDQDFTSSSDIDWTKSIAEIDQQLYKKYNLTPEQVAYIEKAISEMK